MSIGRPLKYDLKKYDKLLEDYIKSCDDRYERFIKSKSHTPRGESIRYGYRLNVKFPSLLGFARYCRISRDTLYDWSKKYPDFSDIIDYLKCIQEVRLINGGLTGKYNSKIVVLILRRLGYKDKKRVIPNESKILDLSDFFEARKGKRDLLIKG